MNFDKQIGSYRLQIKPFGGLDTLFAYKAIVILGYSIILTKYESMHDLFPKKEEEKEMCGLSDIFGDNYDK